LWVTLIAALAYGLWLGAHWLPLDFSDKEMAGFVSRLWDVQGELARHHSLPWWTPHYMTGSSYALNHSQGLYLLPGLLLANFVAPQVAGKLTALLAVFGGALAMYCCARHFLKHEWAAALSAIAFLLHPEQIIRAAGAEHLGVSVWFPFVPLTWWLFARVLETGKVRDAFGCALAVVGMLWAHNKMAFVQCIFLGLYLVYWLWPVERRRQWRTIGRSCLVTGGLAAALGAFVIVPGLLESKHSKLLSGEQHQLKLWQENYSFKSLIGIVDRDGTATRAAMQAVGAKLEGGAYHALNESEARQIRGDIQRVFSLQSDAPEKYAGIVLLIVVAIAILFNAQRAHRELFWFFTGMLLLTVMLASGPSNVWRSNWKTWQALFRLDGVPGMMEIIAVAGLLATAAFLFLIFRRRFALARQRWIATGVLAAFVFVPVFQVLAVLPFFREIRAPFVFYDGPGTFFFALLAGFFITDVLPLETWHRRAPFFVAGIVALLVVDYWPYQKPARDNGVPGRTLANLRATYGALARDPDWVKTYSLSGRYFHLLGPMLGGKPQVWEAFYNWMAPLGIGLLNEQAVASFDAHRAFLNLVGARYVVFDKTDPSNAQQNPNPILAAYRQTFPVTVENEDFVVFQNTTAHAYVTGYARACAYVGDVRGSARLAMLLATRNWPVVQSDTEPPPGRYEQVYRAGTIAAPPPREGEFVTFEDVQLARDSNQRVRIHLNAPRDCLAVIAESYYPYWRATVDGQPATVWRVSAGLMGLELPAGAHDIVLQYEPPRAYLMAGIVSALALLAGVVATIQSWRADR
jgi:hypothetical protein